MRSTVLILGANGRFGLAAAQAFDAAGWQVVASVRRAPAPGMPAKARVITAAIDDIDSLAQDAAGPQALVHALNPPYTEWPRQLMPMARAGNGPRRATRRTLHAARQRVQLRPAHARTAAAQRAAGPTSRKAACAWSSRMNCNGDASKAA